MVITIMVAKLLEFAV